MFTSSSVRRARSMATVLQVSPPFAACKRSWELVFPLHHRASTNQSQYEEGSPCNEVHTEEEGLLLVGGAFGAGIATVVVSAFTLFAGVGVAASKEKPHVVNPPVITGTPQEGKTLTGDRGDWTNNPTDYAFRWLRCGPNGGNCAVIVGQVARTYTLRSVDVGNTIRFRAIATNGDGSNQATSVPTRRDHEGVDADAGAACSNGCPPGNPKQIANMSLPTKLILDRFESNRRF